MSGFDDNPQVEERIKITQKFALEVLEDCGYFGVTRDELQFSSGFDSRKQSTASGVLATLHRKGKVARLSQQRLGLRIYVLPDCVGNRETQEPNPNSRSNFCPECDHCSGYEED